MFEHPDDRSGGLATEGEAHAEWHRNAGVPIGQPCPWDACDPYADCPEEYDPEAEAAFNRRAAILRAEQDAQTERCGF